ncbi:MAG: alpha-glucan family phosphorylase [Eudoraea sp.]|uniref:alpha-glucan family phosphorylase n=1 Tax=Eudoraea sp. TaxID=1979955 RepID=UPI003C712D93
MSNSYNKWFHPYKPAKAYQKKVAYFSMEFGIDQGLKIYSGGLGFLAGSHMRSAFELKQNMIGIGMLWKFGYYDQGRNSDQTLRTNFLEKNYSFLEDSGLEVEVTINENHAVKVRAMVLKPEIFGTVPLYLLTTDVEGNDFLSRTITDHLYDNNSFTRISQNIVLGIGGAKIVQALGGADIYHLNEGHALPALYYLRNIGITKDKFRFTTHTPEKAGNTEREGNLLNKSGFFGRILPEEQLHKEVVGYGVLNYTVSALRLSKRSNAVSKLHAKVAQGMWKDFDGISDIIPITNSQNQAFWQDKPLKAAWEKHNKKGFIARKKLLKSQLFEQVLDQTGKIFNPDVITIVWARRFAQYKRADLILRDLERFERLASSTKYPIQLIWAGKPYPKDAYAVDLFNHLVRYSKDKKNIAILTGYEIALSKKLKTGSDIWLNTPRITREASGTSGMTAAMNGSLNLSINDGWIPEFAVNGKNGFILPEANPESSEWDQDNFDSNNLYDVLENKVLPMYYEQEEKWMEMVFKGIEGVIPKFSSKRMAKEYYTKLYK